MANTNSSLATYTKLTKNKTTQSSKTVKKIIIHHWAGKVTAKQGVDYFVNTDRQVSSNYVIGYDGSIGLSVAEKDRAWTTGSNAVDKDSITIECSNDDIKKYTVSDKTLKALINLCVDICKRNGITKLEKGKNLYGHRDFAATACPGDYLYGKLEYIASEVNKQLSAKKIYRVSVTAGQVGAFSSKDNAEKYKKDLEALGCTVTIKESTG